VGDVSTLAEFPLRMSRATWAHLATLAEQLSDELLAAEEEILRRRMLLRKLALPRAIRKQLCVSPIDTVSPRVMRFDFHWTRTGWRISEVNSDVPGGYAEAGLFTQLVAQASAIGEPSGDPAAALCSAVSPASQVVSYLARELQRCGVTTHLAQPEQVRWRDGLAHLGDQRVDRVIRFYQAEWLAARRHRAFLGGLATSLTPVTNPLQVIVSESKRFPLVWDELRTPLPTWRMLLPETRDPRNTPWRTSDEWLLKTALCNTGDSVSIRELLTPAQWRRVALDVTLRPSQWVAQRRFETVPIDTPRGSLFPCIGVYIVNGEAAGAYARLSHGPIVNFAAIDAALLIAEGAEA
jgi:glutathionylspermidine synthase